VPPLPLTPNRSGNDGTDGAAAEPGAGGSQHVAGPTPNRLALTTTGLVKSFGGVMAVNQVDFRAEPGEIHGLLGENGAGK
jgi:hypothetical protein